MKNVKISLIIPTYNEERYIKNCLISTVTQTRKPDEIIIVDNNSSEITISIAKQFPVRIVQEKKQGMIQARNRGFDEAKGDIIARCDADVHLMPHWIDRIKHDFEENEIDALTGPFIFYDLKLKTTFFTTAYLDIFKPILNGNEVLVGPNMAITKKMWKKVKPYVCLDNKKVHEDIDLAIHINDLGGHIMRDDELIVQVSGRRIRKNPMSFFGEYPLRFIKTLARHKKDIITPFLAQ